jgi:hypothetical protein
VRGLDLVLGRRRHRFCFGRRYQRKGLGSSEPETGTGSLLVSDLRKKIKGGVYISSSPGMRNSRCRDGEGQ